MPQVYLYKDTMLGIIYKTEPLIWDSAPSLTHQEIFLTYVLSTIPAENIFLTLQYLMPNVN